jgi:hypothetical protein
MFQVLRALNLICVDPRLDTGLVLVRMNAGVIVECRIGVEIVAILVDWHVF